MAANPWWVIVATSLGGSPTYVYFQGTQAQAEARAKATIEVSTQKNLYGPYPTEADAKAAVKAGKVVAPTTNSPSIPGIGNPLSAIGDVNSFFASLGQRATWVRILKVMFGGMLILAGLFRISGASKAALGIASKAVLV